MIHNIFALGRFGHHSINLLAVPDFLRRFALDFAPVFDLRSGHGWGVKALSSA